MFLGMIRQDNSLKVRFKFRVPPEVEGSGMNVEDEAPNSAKQQTFHLYEQQTDSLVIACVATKRLNVSFFKRARLGACNWIQSRPRPPPAPHPKRGSQIEQSDKTSITILWGGVNDLAASLHTPFQIPLGSITGVAIGCKGTAGPHV